MTVGSKQYCKLSTCRRQFLTGHYNESADPTATDPRRCCDICSADHSCCSCQTELLSCPHDCYCVRRCSYSLPEEHQQLVLEQQQVRPVMDTETRERCRIEIEQLCVADSIVTPDSIYPSLISRVLQTAHTSQTVADIERCGSFNVSTSSAILDILNKYAPIQPSSLSNPFANLSLCESESESDNSQSTQSSSDSERVTAQVDSVYIFTVRQI